MYKNYIKRLLDITFSLLILILIGWFMAIIALWLHFANKGAGAFFYQLRPGKEERMFNVIKFKSMTDERDEVGNLLPDSQRLTRVGRFVRSTSIDELPQLINVIKGDMSFVGPRPLLPEYLPYYTEEERLRHTVRPGITGWAQVHGRNNVKWDDRLSLDVYYVKNLSFGMDCKVILLTIKNVLSRKDVVVLPDSLGEKLDVERANKNSNLV